MLPPVGLVQEPFRHRVEVGVPGIHQDPAQRLADRGAARLAGLEDLPPRRPQPRGRQAHLRGLAGAFHSLECDEGHAGRIPLPIPYPLPLTGQ